MLRSRCNLGLSILSGTASAATLGQATRMRKGGSLWRVGGRRFPFEFP